MAQPRVLIVEDEAIVAEDLKATATELGYEVCAVAATPEEAQDRLAEVSPDVALLDIVLKGQMTGTELGQRLRCELDIPVVYVTAYADEETLARAKLTEPFGYVLKPFSDRELQVAIEIALHKHRLEEERRRLEREILEISDAERRRIGLELHDGLAQQLLGIRLITGVLTRGLAARSAPEAKDAEAMARLLDEACEHARSLARGMCPLELVQAKLVPALRELAATMHDRFGIACELDCGGPVPAGDAAATHLYHIAREAATNAATHGKARHVHMALAAEGDRTVLTVRDDGVGFPDDVDELKSLGLRAMRYRADVMGASLDIRRHPDGGTIVVCSTPANRRGKEGGVHGNDTREARC